jgi:hypothetical protein
MKSKLLVDAVAVGTAWLTLTNTLGLNVRFKRHEDVAPLMVSLNLQKQYLGVITDESNHNPYLCSFRPDLVGTVYQDN